MAIRPFPPFKGRPAPTQATPTLTQASRPTPSIAGARPTPVKAGAGARPTPVIAGAGVRSGLKRMAQDAMKAVPASEPVAIARVTLHTPDPINKYQHLMRPALLERTVHYTDLTLKNYNWNAEALEVFRALEAGEDVVLVGGGGSGKTTLVLEYVKSRLLRKGFSAMFSQPDDYYRENNCDPSHPRLKAGSPAFIMCSLAHKVVGRMMLELPPAYTYTDKDGITHNVRSHQNVLTGHRALQYRPVRTVPDADDGTAAKIRVRFVPYRGADNRLDEVELVCIDESGQVPLESILRPLREACPNAQFIATGDLGQLGVVGGTNTLGALLPYMRAFELTSIHRNRGDVLEFAQDIRAGKYHPLRRGGPMQTYGKEGRVSFRTYPTQNMVVDDYPVAAANMYCADVLFTLIQHGAFTLGVDFALCPQFPKSSNTGVMEYDPSDTTRFGINAIWMHLAEKLDALYGRSTYCISTASGPRILAAGDTYYADTEIGGQEEYMVMGLVENKKYVSRHGRAPRNYATRSPPVWLYCHSIDVPEDVDDSQFTSNDDCVDYDAIYADEEEVNRLLHLLSPADAEDRVERRSQWTVVMLNITQLRTYIMGCVDGKQEVYDLLRYTVNEMLYCALRIDHLATVAGSPLSVEQIHDAIQQVLDNVKLGGYVRDGEAGEIIRDITRTSLLSGLLPSITTVHKAQGSETEFVVLCTHHSAWAAGNESLYTAATRAKDKVLFVCSSDTFGQPLNADGTPDVATSKRRKPAIDKRQVAGVTLAEKVEVFRKRMENPANTSDALATTEWVKANFNPGRK